MGLKFLEAWKFPKHNHYPQLKFLFSKKTARAIEHNKPPTSKYTKLYVLEVNESNKKGNMMELKFVKKRSRVQNSSTKINT